jgi:hypothetical protein
MVGFLESNGQALLAQQIVAAHELQNDETTEPMDVDDDSEEELGF